MAIYTRWGNQVEIVEAHLGFFRNDAVESDIPVTLVSLRYEDGQVRDEEWAETLKADGGAEEVRAAVLAANPVIDQEDWRQGKDVSDPLREKAWRKVRLDSDDTMVAWDVEGLTLEDSLTLLDKLSEHVVEVTRNAMNDLTPDEVLLFPGKAINALVDRRDLLTTGDAQRMLGVGKAAVSDARKSGSNPLKHIQIAGDVVLFTEEWIYERNKNKRQGRPRVRRSRH